MRIAALACVVAACGGGGDPLDSDTEIAAWANASSALGAFEVAREPVAFADGKFTFDDPACPATTPGATTTITGGCTDSAGHIWTGRATVVLSATTRTVTLDDYGNDAFIGAVASSGTVTITEQAIDQHAFEVDIVSVSGIQENLRYSGTVDGTFDTATTWNGSGTITRDGQFLEGAGTVTATTVDQVRDDDTCPGENLSGETTMTSSDHVVVVTYDGATACDTDHSAQFSRDGEDQGLVTGVSCSTGGGGASWIALAIAALLLRRRATG